MCPATARDGQRHARTPLASTVRYLGQALGRRSHSGAGLLRSNDAWLWRAWAEMDPRYDRAQIAQRKCQTDSTRWSVSLKIGPTVGFRPNASALNRAHDRCRRRKPASPLPNQRPHGVGCHSDESGSFLKEVLVMNGTPFLRRYPGRMRAVTTLRLPPANPRPHFRNNWRRVHARHHYAQDGIVFKNIQYHALNGLCHWALLRT